MTIVFGGERPELKVSNVSDGSVCQLLAEDFPELQLFVNMQDDVKPIACI